MRRLILLILALVAAQLPQTAASAQQPATAAVAFADRAAQLPAVLEGKLPFTDFFTAEFLAAIPPAQLSAVTASLLAQHGAPQGVERIDAVDDVRGTVHIRFAKAIGQFQMTIDPAQGGRVAGLLVAAFSSPDDSSAKVMSEIRALPGVTSLQVARIDGAAPVDLISHNPDQASPSARHSSSIFWQNWRGASHAMKCAGMTSQRSAGDHSRPKVPNIGLPTRRSRCTALQPGWCQSVTIVQPTSCSRSWAGTPLVNR